MIHTIHTPAGPVTVEAATRQVDSAGVLGLLDETDHMVASFLAGEWSDEPMAPPAEPAAPVEAVAEPPAAPPAPAPTEGAAP